MNCLVQTVSIDITCFILPCWSSGAAELLRLSPPNGASRRPKCFLVLGVVETVLPPYKSASDAFSRKLFRPCLGSF